MFGWITVHRAARVWAVVTAGWGCCFGLAGCGTAEPTAPAPPVAPQLVLTFDDGPLAADMVHAGVDDPAALLEPLRQILDSLARRGARAVFFVSGPQPGEHAVDLAATYAAGLAEIARDGHVLGYHGYAHDIGVWANPVAPTWLAMLFMQADLEQLTGYLDGALSTVELRRADVFAPLFRQPYGGYGVYAGRGLLVAASRGWIYHGFRLDSVDWTDNLSADTPLNAGLTAALWQDSPEAHAAYVLARLRDGVAARAGGIRARVDNSTAQIDAIGALGESVRARVDSVRLQGGAEHIDILLHVNHFTAAWLESWMDAMAESFAAATGRPAPFDVPPAYLTTPDSAVDLSVLSDLLASPSGP